MASSLLALLDDIASLLDDVAALTKVATQKTSAVLGDDVALSAQQTAGLRADRELPVVWAVAKGSLRNKAILVPSALVISAFLPWAVTPLLMIGGAYLCYEGFEKIAHKLSHSRTKNEAHHAVLVTDIASAERAKIRGAVRTDFVLSAEIIVITLGVVARSPLWTRVAVLVGIALLMTVGVYGLVAGIVKLDDAGLHLAQRDGDGRVARLQRRIGRTVLEAAPLMMKGLSIAGTAAMLLVGGGILVHGIGLDDRLKGLADGIPRLAASLVLDAVVGIVAGALLLTVAKTIERARRLRAGGSVTP